MMTDSRDVDIDKKLAELMTIYGNSPVFPTEAQWRDLLNYPDGQPIVVVNLMQLASGELRDDSLGFSGDAAQAQAKYAEITTPIVQRLGLQPLYMGGVPQAIIGDDSNQWDVAGLVQYPSSGAFIELHTDADYCKNALPYRRLFAKKHLMLLSEQIPLG